jgi:alkylation response protein AidB-like acyl-CoA dehydrogenase
LMDALYTEEERLLASTMRNFVDIELAPLAAQWDTNEEFPWASVSAMKRMGLMGMTADTAYGGSGASYAELAIAAEEIARVCMTSSTTLLAHLSLGVSTINRFANEEQKERFLPAACAGDDIVAWALSEPSSGSDAADMQTTAVRQSDEAYVLNGSKIFITNAEQSSLLVVFTATNRSLGHKGTTAFVIDRHSAGIEMRGMHGKLGIRGSGTAEVYFTDCEVPAANRLGEDGDGFRIAMSVLDSSRVSLATQSVGLAQGAFEAAIRYAQQRETFGQKLKDRQAIQFMLADMGTQIDAARLLTRRSAQLKDAGQPHNRESAMAKLFASEVAHFCVDKAVQIFGGYGFFRENPVERMYRDQRITEIYEGTSEVQRIVIARSLLNQYAVQ